jgi:hypothetical protein
LAVTGGGAVKSSEPVFPGMRVAQPVAKLKAQRPKVKRRFNEQIPRRFVDGLPQFGAFIWNFP